MEKWNGFCEAAKNSSWKVKLSAVVMGGGQLLYGCWQKGLVYLLVELSVLYYFITRGISDPVGFFTLGTQKADPWTGTAGDNSVVMLLMGIFAWIVIAVFLCIYVSNLKDAYAIERRVKAGEQPISFKAELAQLLDRKFYITALALPVLGSFLTVLTAYTMSRFDFKSRKTMMKTTMILGMFPSFMGMTAVYLLMTQFGLINRLWGLILIYSAGAPMGYLTQKGYFDTIPKAIDEAAKVDGATNFQIFRKINLPLSKPMLVYTALTSFAWPWSDFILPKLLLKEKDLYTVAVGLMSLDETEFARFAAGSVFIAVPIVVLYFSLVKNMISGMSAGAVKG